MPSTPVRHPRIVQRWESPIQRKEYVQGLHRDGYQIKSIAFKLDCTEQTVRRDFAELDLQSFSSVSDTDLDKAIRDVISVSHKAVGLAKVVSYLLTAKGLRVQQHRVKTALVTIPSAVVCHPV